MGRNDDIQIEIRHAGDSVSNDWFNRRAGEMKSSHSTMQTNSPYLMIWPLLEAHLANFLGLK